MDELLTSDFLLVMARVWLWMALGALVLSFVLRAIESHKHHIEIDVKGAYRVPVEPETETEEGDGTS